MRKLLLFLSAGIGALLLAGCYQDDLKEFESINHYRINQELAVPLINQTLDTAFRIPILIPLPTLSFRLADTVNIELPAQDTSEFIIEEVTFKALTENRFTGSGIFSIIFLDDLGARKDSLPIPAWNITAAPAGGVAKDEFSLTVDRKRYDELRQYKKLIIQVDVEGDPNTNLSFTYYLGIKLKGSAKL